VPLVAHSLPIQADPKPQAGTSKNCERLGYYGTADLCEINRRLPDEQSCGGKDPGPNHIERR
jgi:hypothetical protein